MDVILLLLSLLVAGAEGRSQAKLAPALAMTPPRTITPNVYWQAVLPKTPMPGAIYDMLIQSTGDENPRKATVTIGSQNEEDPRKRTMSYDSQDEDPRKTTVTYGFQGVEDPRKTTVSYRSHGEDDPRKVTMKYGSHGVEDSRKVTMTYESQGEEDPRKIIMKYGSQNEDDQRKTSVTYDSHGEEPRKTTVTYMFQGEEDPGKTTVSYRIQGEEDHRKTTMKYGSQDEKDPRKVTMKYSSQGEDDLRKTTVTYDSQGEDPRKTTVTYGFQGEEGSKKTTMSYRSQGEENPRKVTMKYGSQDVEDPRKVTMTYGSQGEEVPRKVTVSYGSKGEVGSKKTAMRYGFQGEEDPRKTTVTYKSQGESHDHIHIHRYPNGSNRLADVFFFHDALRPGSVITPTIPPTTSVPSLLPRRIADSFPFSIERFADIIAMFKPASLAMAGEIRWTLETCEHPQTLPGEKAGCANSLESLAELPAALLGTRDVRAFSAAADMPLDPAGTPARRGAYNVTAVRKLSAGSSSPEVIATCHDLTYPYAVFFCHTTSPAAAYAVTLQAAVDDEAGGAAPPAMEVLAVCHLDTSQWSTRHPFFVAHNLKPGDTVVCHFLSKLSVVWVPAGKQGDAYI